MHRRDFNLGVLKISAAALLSPRLLARPLDHSADSSTDTAPPPIAILYKNAIVIDTLCAPFLKMEVPPTPDLLAAVRHSGITAINLTISELKFDDTVENIADVEALVEQHPEAFLIVRQHSD